MVDYSAKATDINSTIQPESRVVEPPSRQGEIDALQNIGRGVALGAKTVATYFQNSSNLAQSKRLSKFDLDLLNLQNAEDQGVSAQEIRTRSRLQLSQAIANDPNQEQEYLNRYSTWLNQSGYDKVANPAVQQYEVNQQVALTAVQNGFIAPGDFNDPAKVQAGIENYSNYQAEVRALEKEQKDIALQSSKLELSSKQRSDLKAQREESAQTGLSRVASAAVPYWQAQYNDIIQAASKASTEQEKQSIVQNGITRMKNDLAMKKLQLSGSSLDLDQSKLDQVWKPIDNLVDLYSKQLDGSIDIETFERQSKALQAQAKLMTLQNLGPDGRQWAALSEISKNAADVLGPQITQRVIDIWTSNASATTNTSTQGGLSPTERDEGGRPANLLYEKDNVTYLNSVTELIKRTNNGKLDDATKLEVDNQIQGILKGVDVFANANTSAKEFQPLIDFFSNPIVGQYLSSGGKVPVAVANATARVVADGYDQQVIPMLKDELGESGALGTIRIGNQKGKPGDFFEPSFETGRFAWKLKEGVPANFSSSTSLRQLNNSSFTKVFNKMIMANAHLRGDTDYAKSFEELSPLVFDEATSVAPDQRSEMTSPDGTKVQKAAFVDPMVTTAGRDEQSGLDELVAVAQNDPIFQGQDATSLSGELKDIAKAIDIGETGSGDYGTLLGHTNKMGRKFDDADITNKTVDDLIAFSSPGGAYADYSKKAVGRVATPMGRYQIVGTTLRKLKNELGLTGQEQFTPELQDQLFLQLLKGRGYEQYKNGEISKRQFVSNLQKEWEGLKASKESFQQLVASL